MRIIVSVFFTLILASCQSGSINKRLSRLEQQMSSKAYVEIERSLDQLRNEVRDIRGEIEQQTFQLQQTQQQQQQIYSDLDMRLQTLEKATDSSTTINSQPLDSEQLFDDNGDNTRQADKSALNAVPKKLDEELIQSNYDKALQTLRSGDHNKAAVLFQQIVTQYPDSSLADNAQYWLAETMYINSDFEPAKAAFQRVVSQYPDSSKVPDALLKLAFIAFETNKIAEGKKQLHALVKAYPESNAAKLAQKRLDKLR